MESNKFDIIANSKALKIELCGFSVSLHKNK